MSAGVPQQYVITVDTEADPDSDPAMLSGQVAQAVTETLKAIPGVSAVQVVGIA